MATHEIEPRRLLPDSRFNWVYPVDLVVGLIVTLFFLFFFNRVFGSLVAYAIRKYTWYRYRIYIDVQALQISFLAGRVFFKGFRYHGHNETILINDGYITWRYWLRRVREVGCKSLLKHELGADPGTQQNPGLEENAERKNPNNLPCRIKAKIRGVEWFIYNRSPAYDSILENISPKQSSSNTKNDGPARKRARLNKSNYPNKEEHQQDIGSPTGSSWSSHSEQVFEPAATKSTVSSRPHSGLSQTEQSSDLPLMLQIFPIKVECSKGAIVMGNQHTRSILTAKFDSATGLIDAQKASSSLDQYKQLIDLDFIHPVIQLKPNRAFSDGQLAEVAKRDAASQPSKDVRKAHINPESRGPDRSLWSSLGGLLRRFGGSGTSLSHNRVRKPKASEKEGIPGEHRWLGLTRYMDDEDDLIEQERWKAVEYARFETIVDSPGISMSIHWDVAGRVPRRQASLADTVGIDIDGDEPPDWSIDLRIRGGDIHYGPWADRQRTDLQNAFFPTLYKNAAPAPVIPPGEQRISTIFKLVLEVEKATKLILHTREESKDWRWKGQPTGDHARDAKLKTKKHRGKKKEKANLSPEIRPYGWLDLQVMPDSTINFTMDLVARPNGYGNRIELDLRGPEMASSVNHELLWRSKSQIISCDLSNPLEWNKLRQWYINIQSDALEVFLLRDHIFLLTDLISDWTSGPSGDYYTFVPFKYLINLRLTNFRLYVNANDSNIINNPTDVNDNTFVVVWGEHLNADLTIPIEHYQPSRNAIPFDVDARDGGFELCTPQWNTQRSFLKDNGVASLNELRINGSYNYASTTSPALTDILLMEVYGDSPRIHMYGFLIRYLMKIKDNYFGEDLHFRTLEEYKTQVAAKEQNGNANVDSNQHTKISNDLDVILKVSADNSCAVLPSGLYPAGRGITLDIASICGDLRFTNYYMDLGVTFSPISMAYESTMSENLPEIESNTQVFIDGLNLYGHRLFGLPPTEPTYVCNWDFDVGSIHGECDPLFLQGLLLGVRCFGFSFDDIENALPPLNPPIIHDVTFLRLRVQPILVWLRTDLAAFQLGMQSVELDYNDWAMDQYSAKLSVQITELVVAIVDDQGSPLDRANEDLQRTTQANLQTTVNLRMLTRKKISEQDRQLQQSHIRLQDVRTHRTPWLVHNIDQPVLQAPSVPRSKIRPPAMQFPQMPEPLNYGHNVSSRSFSTSSISGRSRTSSRLSTRKSSFLTDRSSRAGNTSQSARRRISSPENQPFQYAHSSPWPPDVSHDPSPPNQRGSLTPQGITSSSPYQTPHFPLQNLKPILQDVPTASKGDRPSPVRRLGGVPLELQHQDQSIAKSTIMIDLTPGVRALCTPSALGHVLNLLTELQLDTVESLLDDLQIDAMAETSVSTQMSHKRSENITEFNIRIPSLQARFLTEPTGYAPSASNSSGLCLGFERLEVNARVWKGRVTDQAGVASDQSSAHVSLGQIDLSLLSKFSDSPHIERLLSCTITDVVLWAAKRETSCAQFTFRDTDMVAMNKGLSDVLPSAFQAIASLATMAEIQTKMTERGKIRFQLLVLSVILAGEEIPDPPFLTRASYVLRSANNHLRSSDSWKLMARLRYILQSLPTAMHTDIVNRCLGQANGCPEDAGIRVAESLAHWRAWDATQVKQSLLMHKIYGSSGRSSEIREGVTTPVKGSVHGGSLRLALLTSCGQSSILIEKLEIALLHNQPAADTGGFIDPEIFSVGDSVMQVHCARLATSLSWDLCELVDTALEIPFDQLRSTPHETSKPSAPIRKEKIQLVVSSTISIIDFESVNFRTTFLCQGLKASTLLSRTATRQSINFIINADAATSEVQSHSQVLTRLKLQRPSIYCCTDNDTHGVNKDQVWKVATSCSSVSFKALQGPLLILEVVDLVLKHEISQAMQVAQDVRKRISQSQHSERQSVEPAANKAHITIFVDSYLLSLTILPTLIYRISGEGARTTMQHGLRDASESLIDFELQDHVHAFRTQRDKTGDEIAAVQIPPIDCHLEFRLGPQQRSIVLNTTIEAMKLEASALHTLLVTFSRPEIADLPKSIDREMRIIQSSNQHLFGAADGDIQEKPSEIPILYDACIIAVGLSVFARSPLSSVNAREGHLDFSLGCIQAKASNRDGTSGVLLPFIEVDVRLDSIQAALERVESTAKIPSGNILVSAFFKSTSEASHIGEAIRALQLRINKFEISMYAETAPVIVDIIAHLQDTLKTIDLTSEFKSLKSIRRPKSRSATRTPLPERSASPAHDDSIPTSLFGAMYSLEMTNIRLSWIVGSSTPMSPGRGAEDLVLSFSRIDLSTRRDNAARLLIENFQMQIVPSSKASMGRSQNSALLPEVVFNVAYLSTGKDRRLAFQAAGKSLDLRLTSKFILPASDLRRSIAFAIQEVRTATAGWKASAAEKGNQTRQLLGGKKFASILVDADFAGAVVYIEGRNIGDRQFMDSSREDSGRIPQHGRYNQFTPDNSNSSTKLQSPGLAFKIEYRNGGADQESLNAEIKVDASNNTLHPTVVPLIMEISSSVKEMMGESSQEQSPKAKSAPSKLMEDDRLRSADPSAVFGKMKVNFGLRICKQEFSLSCQPWAKVAATARFEDIYVTLNTIQSADHGQFFTVSTVFTKPALSVQHTYSREPTGSLNVESVFVSLMSSKHVSAANGLSVILKISPMNLQVNARQLQDVLLFREIWIPQEIRHAPATPAPDPSTEPQAFVVQRYQQVAAASAFPWDAVVSVAQLNIQLDLGQSLGRSTLNISNFWVSSKKTSDSEQNLCLGFDRAGIDATGRMSGLIEVQALRVRTSIQWPMEDSDRHTPLVQASLGFDHLCVKAAFDYQAFALMNITTVDFVMYNVRDPQQAAGDRLVAVVEGDKAQIFCTAIGASQGLALYQAIQRLIEEKQAAYEASLKDIERFLRRRSTINPTVLQTIDKTPASQKEEGIKVPIRLQTNVLVRLGAVSFGVFPSTFFDNQIFRIEAKDASARFSVALEQGKVHSSLGMTLGQLRVALSGVTRPSTPRKVGEVSVDEVAASAAASRGGLILGVPKTVVGMQIWQIPESNHIDYTFRSSFEGNIDVGWNYSRISFIRGMHTSHVRALAQRLGKPLPQSAVQIRGGLKQDGDDDGRPGGEQEKITAVVNVPQSKYDYTALQPALIDTPQLRNLGEATPPLEWIGLNRERLPNLTHQIVIVSLLEVAKEVEDAYAKILGTS